MTRDISRLLRPQSIAVIGGGAWCRAVTAQCRKMGFSGSIWPVHPTAEEIEGLPVFVDVSTLPKAPDAAFIGVNREATIDIVRALSSLGAGGAVCFASGFKEAEAEDASGSAMQDALLTAAGQMPILGPNCYGFINYLDGALLWPDQHGGHRTHTGVALVTQSSNMAINLTMQNRALPLAYVATAGNQAQTGLAEIGAALLEDSRVTALGLHIEGIGDIRAFEALAARARALGKRIVAIKVGRSTQARAATVSHTASLAGEDAGAEALLQRLGIIRVPDLPTFLETLKLLHAVGPLPHNGIATISCSGGEASLAADTAVGFDIRFPPLNKTQKDKLRSALGPRVALANPLDYHTYIWRDTVAMTRAFAGMADPGIAMTLLIVDFPRSDFCDASDWDCAIDAAIASANETATRYGMVATLPELMPEKVAKRLMAAGVVPFSGLTEALAACSFGSTQLPEVADPILVPGPESSSELIPEAIAKAALGGHGLRVPKSARAISPDEVAHLADSTIGYPLVLKGEGVAHKTEAGAVKLNITSSDQAFQAALAMNLSGYLVEEMITGTVAELLIGVVRDPAHGFLLTLGAGGTLTELMDDTASLLIPASDASVHDALVSLRIAPLLRGYRGADAADIDAIVDAVRAVQDYAIANAETLAEIEINPLVCTAQGAIAADALLRLSKPEGTADV
ncbi:acetate--CoA ligase family protein [Sulfitobacter sp. TSTF-M16]|uniref:Acetate--CoA ligase family protein n=1 Tax=Sulfitobacter aestuariivivens TaxID=2766981 RepID=A0A927D8H5_9RHOB|nr:acetate--CoA ligase family protein [Sulfitobacter aestuariivivens]MBD3665157.1 acetate--CoA ligase family protein [Sulfitobacter aestuariivivens]